MEPTQREPTPLRRNDVNKSTENIPAMKHSRSAMLNEVRLYVQYWGLPLTEEAKMHDINQIDIDNERIFEIYPGESHLFILAKSRNIYGFGDNRFNQIDALSVPRTEAPLPIDFGVRISVNKIFCGCDFTFCMANKNDVYAWGLNFKGQLGLGHCDPVKNPTLVRSLSPENSHPRTSADGLSDSLLLSENEFITDIVCGSLHTLALSSRSRIFSCGFGETFALGQGTNASSAIFKEITYFTEAFGGKRMAIDKIECGVSHSACLISRKIFIWGLFGKDKTQLAKKPTMLSLPADIVDFFIGDLLTVILTDTGDVYTIGENIDGQLGHKRTGLAKVNIPFKIEYITGGLNHVFAVNFSKGKIFAWGNNKLGQISPGSLEDCFREPQEMSWLYQNSSFAITCKGNSTFYVAKSPIQLMKENNSVLKETSNVAFEEVLEESKHLKKELDTVSRKNNLLAKENERLKEDVDRLNSMISESNQLEVSKHDSQDSNAEINDSIVISNCSIQKTT
jgi:alpha-tubulin suppressor-like RCC1 family protein